MLPLARSYGFRIESGMTDNIDRHWAATGLLPLVCVSAPRCNETLRPKGATFSELAGNLESCQLQGRPLPGIIGSKLSDRELVKTVQNCAKLFRKKLTAPVIPAGPFDNAVALE